jgi:hypothetical protein
LDFFVEKNNEQFYIKESRNKMKVCGDFQFYIIDILISFGIKDIRSLKIFRANNFYNILFSNYFYFYGDTKEEIENKHQININLKNENSFIIVNKEENIEAENNDFIVNNEITNDDDDLIKNLNSNENDLIEILKNNDFNEILNNIDIKDLFSNYLNEKINEIMKNNELKMIFSNYLNQIKDDLLIKYFDELNITDGNELKFDDLTEDPKQYFIKFLLTDEFLKTLKHDNQTIENELSSKEKERDESLNKYLINNEKLIKLKSTILKDKSIGFLKYSIFHNEGNDINLELQMILLLLNLHSDDIFHIQQMGLLLLDTFYNSYQKVQKSIVDYKFISNISTVTYLLLDKMEKNKIIENNETLKTKNILLTLIDFILVEDENKYIGMRDNFTNIVFFNILNEKYYSKFALEHIGMLMNIKMKKIDYSLYCNILNGYFNQFSNKNTQLKLKVELLLILEKILLKENGLILQNSLKSNLISFFDNLVGEENFNSEITPVIYMKVVLKVLNSILYKNYDIKKYFFENGGFDNLKQLILKVENNKPSEETFNDLYCIMFEENIDREDISIYSIQNYFIIPLIFDLINFTNMKFKNSTIELFIELTENNSSNQNSCCSIHLIEYLIELLVSYEKILENIDKSKETEFNSFYNFKEEEFHSKINFNS